MPLSPGARLGPYEILAPLGAGGMGEVYRARDERLKRDVAIKVLPASFSTNPDRLRRFEQEAQAASALNHPNILVIYDIGTQHGSPYIVSELLEGETLRSRLAGGALSPRKAVGHALEIAHGLAAAHEKGIVHRDLKPENIFVTKDGRIKILDFGLAKLTQSETGSGPQSALPTMSGGTEPGVVLGTLGYMSPEQVRGRNADARSDIFSFGAILYEVLSGRRAFHGDTAADTMSAILMKDAPDLSLTNQNISPGLERVVRHCLEKDPEQRFHSAHDLAFDLEALSAVRGQEPINAAVEKSRRWPLVPALLLSSLAAAALLGYLGGLRRGSREPLASFQQLTFRRGTIWSARFGSDGKTVLYSASWDGNAPEIFTTSPGSPESRPFGIPTADLQAVSSSGEVAVTLRSSILDDFRKVGTLARVSSTGGGAPRELLEEVEFADWASDSKELAAVRTAGGRTRLEFPIGKTVYETTGWIGNPRVSAKRDLVAFIDHPSLEDDGGSIAIVDRRGKKTTLSSLFASAVGLAWSADGSEIWFTASELGNRALRAVSVSGKQRLIRQGTGSLTIQDVFPDGRALVSDEPRRMGMVAQPPGANKERDLSWLDWSYPAGLSSDGRLVLFFESGEGGGSGYSVYIRGSDGGSPAIKLGDGNAVSLSPDGKWALTLLHKHTKGELILYPTGAGPPRLVSLPSVNVLNAQFLPDGRGLLVSGTEAGRNARVYLTSIDGDRPRPVTPEKYWNFSAVSPDGKRYVVRGPDEKRIIYSLDGASPIPVAGLSSADYVLGWTQDDHLYVQRGGAPSARIDRLDPMTGHAERWKEIAPSDAAGVVRISRTLIAPDGKFYVYAYPRVLSTLYLVNGLK